MEIRKYTRPFVTVVKLDHKHALLQVCAIGGLYMVSGTATVGGGNVGCLTTNGTHVSITATCDFTAKGLATYAGGTGHPAWPTSAFPS